MPLSLSLLVQKMTMTIDRSNHVVAISEFNSVKQTRLFSILKRDSFTGELTLNSATGQTWSFYLYSGRIFTATSNIHPVRRWCRYVSHYCPIINLDYAYLQQELRQARTTSEGYAWEYELLYHWTRQGRLERKQAENVISSILVELFFDISQATEITYSISPKSFSPNHIVLLDPEQAIRVADCLWKDWQSAKIADRSPNRAPLIKYHSELKQRTSEATYANLSKLLDGKYTLRDLSIKLQKSLVSITQSLLPYLQMGLVELVPVDDWRFSTSPPISQSNQLDIPEKKPVVACIDDSPLVCKLMEKILSQSGCQPVMIKDSMRALAIVLERRPELIFLDLVMPNTNGYEICGQLRKLSFFRQTPIIIITGNDGVIDRVRAKLVGATDFVSKPIDQAIILGMLNKHLSQESAIN